MTAGMGGTYNTHDNEENIEILVGKAERTSCETWA
jgi:hypothetical protein